MKKLVPVAIALLAVPIAALSFGVFAGAGAHTSPDPNPAGEEIHHRTATTFESLITLADQIIWPTANNKGWAIRRVQIEIEQDIVGGFNYGGNFHTAIANAAQSSQTVTNTNDGGPGSLRQAILDAADADTITFGVTGIITLTSGELLIDKSITIEGPGTSDLAVSGNNSSRVFNISGNEVSISGLTIQNGNSSIGGGIRHSAGTLILANDSISNNVASGGIPNDGSGAGYAGGIYNLSGSVTLTNTTVANNIATAHAGGILNVGTMTVSNSTISGNTTTGSGSNGGGILNEGPLTLQNSQVLDNDTDGYGGGILNSSSLTINSSKLSDNSASVGGALWAGGQSTTIDKCTFSGNSAFQGGGLHHQTGPMTVTNSLVFDNSASPGTNGGGIWNAEELTLRNVTVANNIGGGILNGNTLSVSNGTISGNSDGGILSYSHSTLKNTILAQNLGGNCQLVFGSIEDIASQNHNLSDDGSCSGFIQAEDLNSTPAGLDPNGAQDNTGPTLTIALLASSSARNAVPIAACKDTAGNPVPTDQRGVSRPQGPACDVGAYEFPEAPPPPTLGIYPNASILLSANTTVTPDAVPTNAMSMNVSATTDFKGKLEGDPTTGMVRVTDAHPAGTYNLTVTAINSGGATATRNFTLAVTTPLTCTPVSFGTASNTNIDNNPYGVAIGDFNGDGVQDLATNNPTSNNVSILLGNGSGGFSAASHFGVGILPSSVAVGDFNGDGNEDLAVTNATSADVSILLGNGSGGFGAAANFGVGTEPSSVAVGDFNGDSRKDLAVGNRGAGSLSILLGNGSGSFSTATNFGLGNTHFSVVIGDFNGDGIQDLASANPDSTNVSILLGNGDGSFSSSTIYGFNTPVSVAVGDFNGDGRQDLAVANAISANVSILLGNGLGGFGSPANFGTGPYPRSLEVGDFNGDGVQDLAIANTNSAIVSILLGNGSGSFSSATTFGVGANPPSIAVGDFNGDGKQDLATANSSSSNVSILLRNCAPPPTPTPTPQVMIAVSGLSSVAEDSGSPLVFTLARTGDMSGPLSVNLFVNGTALLGSDYSIIGGVFPGQNLIGSVTFGSAQATAIVNVQPIADTTFEPDETVLLTIAPGPYGIGVPATSTGIIVNDDAQPSSIQFPPPNIFTVNESQSQITIPVFRTGDISGTSSVTVSSTDGTATGGAICGPGIDYVSLQPATAVFLPNTGVANITVTICADLVAEPTETLTLTLSDATGASLGSPTTATVNILNSSVIGVGVAPAAVLEDGGTPLVFTFTRSGDTTNALTVNVATGGTAGFGSDYTTVGGIFNGPAGVVVFPAGSATSIVSVQPASDSILEPDETVSLNLIPGPGYFISIPPAATGTIVNDDVSVQFGASAVSVPENVPGGSVTLTINRTGYLGSTANVLIDFFGGGVNSATGGSSCGTGVDYLFPGGGPLVPVNFAVGASTIDVPVTICNDSVFENTESFNPKLNGLQGLVGTPSIETVTITDDDPPSTPDVSVAIAPPAVSEGSGTSLVYTFTRSNTAGGAQTVNFFVGGTASPLTDYLVSGPNVTFAGLNGSVTFFAGSSTATVNVVPINDNIVEPDETVIIQATAGIGYNLGPPPVSSAVGVITNDDATVQFPAPGIISVPENVPTGFVTLSVTRSGFLGNPANVTIDFFMAPGSTATGGPSCGPGVDYVFPGGGPLVPVNFLPGASTVNVAVTICNDNVFEPNETFTATLVGTPGLVGVPSTETVTITDDDAPPSTVQFSSSAVTIPENIPGGSAIFTVTRAGFLDNAASVTVQFNFGPGNTATAAPSCGPGIDYVFPTGPLFLASFAPGVSSVNVPISICDDNLFENTETFSVVLVGPSGPGTTIGVPSFMTVTITDDDLPPPNVSIVVTPLTVAEGSGIPLVFTFARSDASAGPQTVNFGVGGTAILGSDYSVSGSGPITFAPSNGTVTFLPGALTTTLNVTPVNDNFVEQDETVILIVTAGAGYNISPQNSAVGFIVNDDTVVTLSLNPPAAMAEDAPGALVYTLARLGVTNDPLAVNFSIGGTASFGIDYTIPGVIATPVSGTVNFPAGAVSVAFLVDPTQDTAIEPTETVVIAVTSGAGYSIGNPSVATGTILNDDFDATPPTITPIVTGLIGSNGWYIGDVSITWTINDPESPITSVTGCATSNVTTDTTGVTFSCSASSNGGTTVAPDITIKRDAAAPVLSLPPTIFVDAATPAGTVYNYSASANDAIGGGETVTCDPASGSLFPIGENTISCSASDAAGNTRSDVFKIFVTTPEQGPTPTGNDVPVTPPGAPLTLTFNQVSQPGVTTVQPIDPETAPPIPSGFAVSNSSYEIQTTATFAGPIVISFNVPEVNDPAVFANLRVLHGENGVLVDRTILPPDTPAPDFATRTIWARVTSLSPFVIAGFDTTIPASSAAPSQAANGAGWHKSDVTVTVTAQDNVGGTGVKNITFSTSGAQTTPPTTVSGSAMNFAITTEGTTVVAYFAADNAGNIETGHSLVVKIDKTLPNITVTTPAAGSIYVLGQAVSSNYACNDSGSDITSCVGTVANGSAINTSTTGTKSFSVTATDAAGNIRTASNTYNIIPPPLTAIGPAQVWVGLKNSDDVGTKFDLLAEVLRNGTVVGSGQLNDVVGGSSGFNNAKLDVINLALSQSTGVGPGDTLSFRLSVRIAASSGHVSGTARLWFNDAAANSGLAATIGGVTSNQFLRTGFLLGTSAGPGPKTTIDVLVNRNVGGNPFKPFGTWNVTF